MCQGGTVAEPPLLRALQCGISGGQSYYPAATPWVPKRIAGVVGAGLPPAGSFVIATASNGPSTGTSSRSTTPFGPTWKVTLGRGAPSGAPASFRSKNQSWYSRPSSVGGIPSAVSLAVVESSVCNSTIAFAVSGPSG